MSKSRQKPTPWLTLFVEGDPGALILVTAVLDRVARRCGEAHLGEVPRAVKRFFAIFFQSAAKPAENRGFNAL